MKTNMMMMMAMIMTILMMMMKGLTGEKKAVVRCARRLGGSDVKARLIKEAAHKRNQIGLLLPSTCHVWAAAAIYLQRKRCHDPQS